MHLKASLRSKVIFDYWKPFKNDEKCSLFYLESSFRSQDIEVIVMTFWSCRKMTWLEKQG